MPLISLQQQKVAESQMKTLTILLITILDQVISPCLEWKISILPPVMTVVQEALVENLITKIQFKNQWKPSGLRPPDQVNDDHD